MININGQRVAELGTNNGLWRRYLRGDGVDQLLGRISWNTARGGSGGWDTMWYLTDRQGSVLDIFEQGEHNILVRKRIKYDGRGAVVDPAKDERVYGDEFYVSVRRTHLAWVGSMAVMVFCTKEENHGQVVPT